MTLDEADRESLLLLAAYRNRIFRDPPPVLIRPGSILSAYDALRRLVENLLRT